MSDPSQEYFLRRMTRGGRPESDSGEMTPAKALRLALAKAGQDVLSQVLDGSGVQERRVTLPKLAESLPDGALTILMHGPSDARGLISLDRNAVSAVTEGLTTGRISAADAPDRPPTAVDAMLCQGFVLTLLTVFAARLLGHPAAEWATGFVPEDQVPDLRRLPLLMEDEPYRVVSVDVDFAGGNRNGQICFVVPWDGRHISPRRQKEVPVGEEADKQWSQSLEKAVLPAAARLEAVLHRVTLPLAMVQGFKVGDVIPIPMQAVEEVGLEDANGQQVAVARLGQTQGYRALRLEVAGADAPQEDAGAMALPAMPETDLADAMANAPGFPGESDLPDLGGDAAEPMDFSAMPMEDDSGEGGDDVEIAPLDLGDLPMTDLDDLPMTIE